MTDLSAMSRVNLEAWAEHLEFCIRQLTEEQIFAEWPLTPLQKRIFGLLWARKGNFVARESLMAAMYWDRPDDEWPVGNVVSAQISYMRAHLAEHGLRIVSSFGQGYSLRGLA